MRKLTILAIAAFCAVAHAQYGRMDFQLQSAQGQAIAGATVSVYAQPACGSAYSGLATVYPAATGGTPVSNPLTTDGFGEAHGYVAAGCYTVVYFSQFTGTRTFTDQSPSISGGATYPPAGVPQSTGSAWGASLSTVGTGLSLLLPSGTAAAGDYVDGSTFAWTALPFRSLTTTGTSGAATLSSGVLNIPQYSQISGMTAGQVPIAATASTVTSSKALAGSGAAITTGPTTTTANDCVKFNDATGTLADAGAACGTGGGGVTQIIAGSNVSISPSGGTGAVTINSATGMSTPVDAQTGTTYTLVIGDAPFGFGTVTMNNAATNTVTVPPNSSVAYPVGSMIEFVQLGAGQTTIVAGSGVTIDTPTSLSARAQYSIIGVKQVATNVWVAYGDLQ